MANDLKICKTCGKEYTAINCNSNYCSKSCRKKGIRKANIMNYRATERKRYLETKEQKRENYRRYYEKHKLRLREVYRLKAKRDIDKNTSRTQTRRIINLNEEIKKRIIPINMSCKECGATENLEIHHEIYPRRRKDIINAILNNQIYFLCPMHHGKTRWKHE